MFKILMKKLRLLNLSNLFETKASSCDALSADSPKEERQIIDDEFKYIGQNSFSQEGFRPREHRGFHKGG